MTFFEIDCLLKHKENRDTDMWAMTRYMSASSLNSNPYLKKRVDPKDLFPLSIDIKKNIEIITKEEFVDQVKLINSIKQWKPVIK